MGPPRSLTLLLALLLGHAAALTVRAGHGAVKLESREDDLPLHRGHFLQKDISLTALAAPNGTETACPAGCQRNGDCDFSTGACTCQPGFYGPACSQAFVCVDQCNYRGVCVADGVCECIDGFVGSICETDVRCPDDCSGHGTCADDGSECVCQDGFEGETCAGTVVPVMADRTWTKVYPPETTEDIGSKPDKRQGAAGVVYGDRSKSKSILIWGGESAEESLDSMWLYDHTLKQWHRKAQKGLRPGPRYDAAAAGTDEKMYMFGGYEPCDGSDKFSDDFWSFTFQTDLWERVPTLLATGLTSGPIGRVGHSLTYVDGAGFIMFGGIHDSLPLSDTWRWIEQSSKWFKLTPASFGSRQYHASTAATMGGNKVALIHGGRSADNALTDTIAYYDIGADMWVTVTAAGDGPVSREKHAIVAKDSLVFMFGGMSGSGVPQSDMWILDFGSSPPTWQGQVDATGAVEGRASAVVAMLMGSLVVLTGRGPSEPSDTVYSVSSETQTWEQAATLGDLPVRRMLMTGTVMEDKMWIFGGQTEVGQKLDDLWELSLVASDAGHVWMQHMPTAVAASDSASAYTCGAAQNTGTASTGQGVVTTEANVLWPQSRSAHAATSLSGLTSMCGDFPTLFIFGGIGANDAARNDLWYWCAGSQQWAEVTLQQGDGALLPAPRSHTSLVVADGMATVFGGMTGEKVRLNDLWQCTLASGLCVELQPEGDRRPHTRRGMNMHVRLHKGVPEFLVFGGYWKEKNACSTCGGVVRYVDQDKTVDLWQYQSQYSRWKKMFANHAPDQRYCPGTTMKGDMLFMFGGYAMDGLLEHNDFWSFDTNQAQWSRLPAAEGQACPAGRHDHVSANWVQQQDGSDAVTAKFIVYGGIGLHGILGDIWMTDVTDVAKAAEAARLSAKSHHGSRLVHMVA